MEKDGTRNAEAIAFLAFAKMLAIVFFAGRIYEDPRNLGLSVLLQVPIEPVTTPDENSKFEARNSKEA